MEFEPNIFQPGIPLVLEAPGLNQAKMTSFFRGYRPREYLVIDHPTQEGQPAKLRDYNEVVGRFIHEGRVYGFRSRVKFVVRRPFPLVFLIYPNKVEAELLRKDSRYPVVLEAVCSTQPLEGSVAGIPRATVLNISQGGCRIQSAKPFKSGITLYLTVVLPERGQVNDLAVLLRRVEKRGGHFLLGTQFADLDEDSGRVIQDFLEHLAVMRVRA